MTTIGMIGVGNMGLAIAKAILKEDFSMILHNRTMEKIAYFTEEYGAETVEADSLDRLIEESDLIFIGVKPKQFSQLFEQMTDSIQQSQPKTWVSMAAGLPIEQLVTLTPDSHKWIRIMPNTPVEVGEGYVAYSTSKNIEEKDVTLFEKSLKASGIIEAIPEELFDAVIGLAGSSPAFVYQLIEAMSDAGVKYGLTREQSHRMAAQAVKGSASMVIETGLHPGQLKDQVTSPGGTTIAGVVALEHAGFKSAIHKGISATVDKSIAMTNEKQKD